jgi:hypothetical protein
MKNKISPANEAAERPLQRCPKCGSDKIWRIQRSVAEKIIYLNSQGKYAARKYECKACANTYLIHSDGKLPEGFEAVHLEPGTAPLINCIGCGKQTIAIGKVSDQEINRCKDETGKTIFRKLSCNNCGLETLIFLEEYEQANGNEI